MKGFNYLGADRGCISVAYREGAGVRIIPRDGIEVNLDIP